MKTGAISLLNQAEAKWLSILYAHCFDAFRGIHLPSHDHAHHFRVWQNAKKLVLEWEMSSCQFTLEQLEQLMIAVFFHDQGMNSTIKPEHGKVSTDLCSDFLKRYVTGSASFINPILTAVCEHDNKDYQPGSPEPSNSLLNMLNFADDLDAFGLIGVYRYAEIMLLRGISVDELPNRVLANIAIRYTHLSDLLPDQESPFSKFCRQQYHVTDCFYRAANNISIREPGGMIHPKDARLILNQIEEKIIRHKLHPLTVRETLTGVEAAVSTWWMEFTTEWNRYKYPSYE
jgi:hypothetical protein